MVQELREKLPQIAELCRRHGAVRLDVFGSAARDDLDPTRSDYDFLVRFVAFRNLRPAKQYFGPLHALEDLLGREVHLAEDFPGQRPTFLARIEHDRRQLYAA